MEYIIQNPDGQRFSSESLDDIAAALRGGTLSSDCIAWHEGLLDWIPVLVLVKPEAPQQHAAREVAGKAAGLLVKAGNGFAGLAAKGYKKMTLQNRFSKALAAMLEDGRLDDAELDVLRQMVKEAGGNWSEVITECQPIAVRFIRHMLADATADEEVTPDEEKAIYKHIRLFELDGMNSEVHLTINRVRALHALRENRLPTPLTLSPPWIKSGEAIHAHQNAEFCKEGVAVSAGDLWITATRIEYVSAKSPCSIDLKNIREVSGRGGSLKITDARKGVRNFRLADGEMGAALILCLLRSAHRTATVEMEDTRQDRRRITKEVRNAVWIRDGGRCMECAALDYLEFDHLIPVAKGGSNTVNNIQLLCRRCNGSKGDRI